MSRPVINSPDYLSLSDLRPGDLLHYVDNPRIPIGMADSVLLYLRPHDDNPTRAWEVGVFLNQRGTIHYECVLYLRRA